MTNSMGTKLGRRQFLKTAAVAGAGMALAKSALTAEDGFKFKTSEDDLNIAIIGVGKEGQVLRDSIVRIPGIHVRALCDIWPYNLNASAGNLRAFGHDLNTYEDYRDLLAQEGSKLDAVVVATPDWVHAEHANACMEAGLPVYCEKEMSNSLKEAQTMVETARRTNKLLQIGHQRRSNPRYLHAIDTLVHDAGIFGRITHAYGQWNRAVQPDISVADSLALDAATLSKYGYENMHQLLNWRWYKKFGGGPIVDLGSHQIDIFTWVFGINPKSVCASGGLDYYDPSCHDWYDNVLCIFEYDVPNLGTSRAMYQVLTTSSNGGFYEKFMGEEGTLNIAEVPTRGNGAEREARVEEGKWLKYATQGLLKRSVTPIQINKTKNVQVDVRDTLPTGQWPIPVGMTKPAHQPHLENFFNAVRKGEDYKMNDIDGKGGSLNCPAWIGYETAVAVLKVNEAVAARKTLDFDPHEFHV